MSQSATPIVTLPARAIPAENGEYGHPSQGVALGHDAAALEATWQAALVRFDPANLKLRRRVLASLTQPQSPRKLWLKLRWLEHGPLSVSYTRQYFEAMTKVALHGDELVRERAREWLCQAGLSGLHQSASVRVVLSRCHASAKGLSAVRLKRLLNRLPH